jgi:hypothetical protein
MSDPIDWKALAKKLGTLRADGEQGSSDDGRRALEILLGEDRLRETVDYYVRFKDGSELARAMLSVVRPWSAMRRCYEIYKTSGDAEVRQAAVELLRVIADRRALRWVDEFLRDADEAIRGWGVGVLDQLLWSGLVQVEEGEDLLGQAERSSDEHVRERAAKIREYLSGR